MSVPGGRAIVGAMLLVSTAAPLQTELEEQIDATTRLANCIISYESRWNPDAYNPRSGAAGWGQFLLSTWLTTPQGKAGASRYDPYAAHPAVVWMIRQGRTREFAVWRLCV